MTRKCQTPKRLRLNSYHYLSLRMREAGLELGLLNGTCIEPSWA